MKHKDLKYIFAVLAIAFLWSCKKQLNVYPTTSEVDGNVIVDAKSASTVLNGVYYRFANAGVDYNQIPSVKWSDINEIYPSEFAGSLSNSSGDDRVYSLGADPKSVVASDMWNYGYQLVNAANGFLKNVAPVTTIPSATKKQMIAEAKFLRAFGDAHLLLYFGQYYDPASKYGIILRDEFVTSTNITLPRSTVAQTYTSILADLEAAIPDLPKTNTKAYYANASAAKILEARVLINRGASGDYAKVISLTKDVIANGGFSLEANLKDLFLTKGFTSTEVILGVQPFATETWKYQTNQYYGQYPASSGFVNLLANDPRNQWLYRDDQGGTVYGGYYGSLNEITKYYSGDTANPSQTPLSETCYAFRLTEAYLLEAEAITLSGGDLATAKDLLKTIEGHAGITDFSAIDAATTATALQELVVKEEIKNFFAEAGQDWFALRRLGITNGQPNIDAISKIQTAAKSVNQLILPIPNSEITTNGNVIQNP
ncbi:RagB/SusD family nutrient uptake outer membrane protein [Mucilaginibacter ximonensis]|uniref:RagB/SusD family nutrient uptake outer membrane protein n=1 Tax=Mucilaginibacter ximonensis TaxID=538021 RepID=A0ABW5YHB9_9SPHI